MPAAALVPGMDLSTNKERRPAHPTPRGRTDRTQGLSSREFPKERASGVFPANVRAFYRCISLLLPTRGKGVCHFDVSSLRQESTRFQQSAAGVAGGAGVCAAWRWEEALTVGDCSSLQLYRNLWSAVLQQHRVLERPSWWPEFSTNKPAPGSLSSKL